MKHLLAVILVFHTSICFSQNVSLVVIDSIYQKPVPFCAVVNKTKAIGGYTDSIGAADVRADKGDTVQVSALGYAVKNLVVQTFGVQTLLLNPLPNVLPPVTVANFFWLRNKQVAIRNFGKRAEHFNNVVKGVTLVKYFPSPDTSKNWVIGFLHLPVNVKEDYIPRLARVYFYEATNKGDIGSLLPSNHDEIFTLDKIVDKNLIIDINKLELVIPKNGCYIAIEFVGYANNTVNNKGIFAIQSSSANGKPTCFMRYFTNEFVPYHSYRGSTINPLNIHLAAVLFQYDK